jgi:hypothetical protein
MCGLCGNMRAVQVLLENYVMLTAALENQNWGRVHDMLQYVAWYQLSCTICPLSLNAREASMKMYMSESMWQNHSWLNSLLSILSWPMQCLLDDTRTDASKFSLLVTCV